MKVKVSRASLAGVLTAALFMSLLPAMAAQTQQGTITSRARRGKNGDPVNRASDTQDITSQEQNSAPKTKPEAGGSTIARPNNQSSSVDRVAQSQDPRADSFPTQAPSDSQTQSDAPPFDRPPLRPGSRTGIARPGRNPSEATPTAPRDPVYSDTESRPRTDSRDRLPDRTQSPPSTRDRSSESSNAGAGDSERSSRSGGRPPVLRRPADSRTRDDSQGGNGTNGGAVPGNQPANGDEVIKLESTLVDIPLLVSDRSGRYVPQLTAKDFELYEDGVKQKIASFGSEEVPFNVVLLLDVSPSVQGNEDDIQDAAIAFVRQLRSQDRVMVVSFDRNIHYLSDFTNDRRQLEWAIRQARTGQGTSVYDAVYEVVERKLRGIDGRKALILFSDGEDTTSGHVGYDDAVGAVSESDVLVYGLRYPGAGGGHVQVDPWPRSVPRIPFPFPWPTPGRRRWPFPFLNLADPPNTAGPASAAPQRRSRRRGGDFMADVTAAGGGPVYDAEKISDLSRLANRIAEELRHVYVISYYPSNPLSTGGYRSVRVSVPGRTDIAVRHRKGYNARPSGSAKSTI